MCTKLYPEEGLFFHVFRVAVAGAASFQRVSPHQLRRAEEMEEQWRGEKKTEDGRRRRKTRIKHTDNKRAGLAAAVTAMTLQ
jgi:hypothetical protein